VIVIANILTPAGQLIIGAILVIGIGILAFLDTILNTQLFVAIVVTYGVSTTAYGVYLMENSTAIHSFWKYIVIIAASAIGYGLTVLAGQWLSISTATEFAKPALIAAFVIVLANFILNDAQTYAAWLPDNVVTDITYFVGAIVVAAQSIEALPQGTVVTVSVLLATVVPVVLTYLFQSLPWSPPVAGSTVAAQMAAMKTV